MALEAMRTRRAGAEMCQALKLMQIGLQTQHESDALANHTDM